MSAANCSAPAAASPRRCRSSATSRSSWSIPTRCGSTASSPTSRGSPKPSIRKRWTRCCCWRRPPAASAIAAAATMPCCPTAACAGAAENEVVPVRLCRRGDPDARTVRRRASGRLSADAAVRPRRRERPAVRLAPRRRLDACRHAGGGRGRGSGARRHALESEQVTTVIPRCPRVARASKDERTTYSRRRPKRNRSIRFRKFQRASRQQPT